MRGYGQYGEWKSPITAQFITSAGVGLSNVKCSATGGLYWLESRPEEAVSVPHFSYSNLHIPRLSSLERMKHLISYVHYTECDSTRRAAMSSVGATLRQPEHLSAEAST